MDSRCIKLHKHASKFARFYLNSIVRPSVNAAAKIRPPQIHGSLSFSTSSFYQIERRPESPNLKESYHHATSNKALCGLTVGNLLQQSAEKFPDREFVVFCEGNHRRTFSQFLEEADKLAAGLLQLGIQKGDRVGIWGPNTLEWVLTQFATARIGSVLVNVNPGYQAHEMEHALHLVGCKALIASETYKTQNYYELLHKVAPDIEKCQPGHLNSKALPDLKTVIMISDKHLHGTYKFHDVISSGGPREVAKVHNMQKDFQFDDPINIQFTSGTTGRPKGATLSHHNIVNNAILIGDRLGFDDAPDRICCQVPLYHCFGMVGGMMCAPTHGATVVFPTSGYDPAATIKSLVEEDCTTVYGTPTMFIDISALLEAQNGNKYTFPSLNKGIMAGSTCPAEVINRADQHLGTKIQNQISTIDSGVFSPLSKATVQVLSLKLNKLTVINKEDFVGLEKLKNLILDNNLIQSIAAEALNSLHNIRRLSLDSNRLTEFPNGVNLPLLSTLSLAHNRLTSLHNGVFSGMIRLTHVNISSNKINFIDEVFFDGLKKLMTLDLSSNQLVTLADLGNGKQLTNLYLDPNLWHCDCNIQNMRRWIESTDYDVTCASPPDLAGQTLKSFTIEELRCQAPHHKPKSTASSPVTTALAPLAQPVLTGSNQFFCPPKCVCAMDIRHINCNRRGYAAVPSKLPSTTALLDLRDNKIRALELNSFVCPHVISIHLQRNGLQRIKAQAFRHLSKLVYLYLNRNQISDIEAGAFEGLENLSYLFLDHNRIASIPSGLFRPLASIYAIYMRRNYVAALSSDSLQGLEHLRWFYLSGNRLAHIDDDAFKFSPSLQRLDLGSNEISTFPAKALTDLTVLNHLDLSGNFIDVIPASLYKWLTQIQWLDLSSNQIHAIEGGFLDKLLDLKSLNISDNLLRHLPELPPIATEVKLSNNTWSCDCKLIGLYKWVKSHQSQAVTCSAPTNRVGQNLASFQLSDFECSSPRTTKHTAPLTKPTVRRRKKPGRVKPKKNKKGKAGSG